MSNNPIRRKLLKASVYGSALVGGTATKTTNQVSARADDRSPSADSNPQLFRLIDNGAEKEQTLVRLIPVNGGDELRTYTLETTGSQHPDMQEKSLEEKFPHVASDLDSFDGLSPGKYTIEVENDEVVGQATFRWEKTGLRDGKVIKAMVMSDGRVNVDVYHSDPAIQTEQ